MAIIIPFNNLPLSFMVNLTEKNPVMNEKLHSFKVVGNRKRNNNANMPCKFKLSAF